MPQAPFPLSRLTSVQDDAPDDLDDLDDVSEGGESSDSQDHVPPSVMEVGCRECGTTLSSRGMRVFLVADIGSSLFSTDIPSDAVREGGPHEILTCECAASDLHCRGCERVVGYHVLRPCRICGSSEHNGHFWLFSDAAVSGTPSGLTWDQLPYNGEPIQSGNAAADDDATADADADAETAAADASTCPVCASAPMWRPHRFVTCGHVFCFGCASREIDMRGACPLDRVPATRAQLEPCDAQT